MRQMKQITAWATGVWLAAGAFTANIQAQPDGIIDGTQPASLPEVKVSASGYRGETSPLAEERRIGENNQPEWTTARRFATTRTYVIAPWQFEFEQWWKGKFLRNGDASHLFQSELEIGLPYRFQL